MNFKKIPNINNNNYFVCNNCMAIINRENFKNNIFKSQKINNINIKVLLEIYLHNVFKKNKSSELYKLINFYNKKYNDVIKYNLDLETYYLEVKKVFIK